jgi:phenylacetate-CoA ligase
LKGKSSKDQYNQIICILNDADVVDSHLTYLKKLLFHSYKNVPFYSQRLEQFNAVKDDASKLNEFKRLPLLTKTDIRNNMNKLTSKDIVRRKWYYNKTSGSTGVPLKVIQDEFERKWRNATLQYYYRHIVSIDNPSAKKVMLVLTRDLHDGNIRFRKKMNHWLYNVEYLNVFKMNDTDMERYVRIINSSKPDMIECIPSALYELCRFIVRKGKSIHQPQVIISSAENLQNYMRETIEDVFGTKIYDFYGSREAHAIAGECKSGLLHLFTFNNHIEILNEQNLPVRVGETGKVVVTPLHNYVMPLIRYEIGDIAVLGPQRCKCGNPLPTLKEVVGKSRHFFIKEDGGMVHGGQFMYQLRIRDWIKAFQVIQEDYAKIRVLIVPQLGINNIERREIDQNIKKYMGKDCEIMWDFVDEIPRSPGGKYLYVKSLLYDREDLSTEPPAV